MPKTPSCIFLTAVRGHYDIRPENVVVVSNGATSPSDWQFKFAHFGLNHASDKVSIDGEPVSSATQDTAPYGTYLCPPSHFSVDILLVQTFEKCIGLE
jgi:hypothetical protein